MGRWRFTRPPVTLQGIEKSFRSPEGPVHAVRGIDVSIARARSSRCSAERGRQVDDDRCAARTDQGRRRLGRAAGPGSGRRDQGGADRRDAPDRVAPARPDGARDRHRDRLALSRRRRGRRGARAGRHRPPRRAPDAEAVGRRDPARPLRDRDRDEPRAARARRADSGDGRRRTSRLLDDDARVRGAREDGALRDALPRGSRRVRRPRRADGARPRRRRRADHRDQGDGRAAHDPCDAPRCGSDGARRAARRCQRRRAVARRSSFAAPTRTPPFARCSRSTRTPATSRSPAPASRRRSWS